MPEKKIILKLLRLREKNKLSIQFYRNCARRNITDSITAICRDLCIIKESFSRELETAIFNEILTDFDVYTGELKPTDCWMDYDSSNSEIDQHLAIEIMLSGERRAITDYREVLQYNLTNFEKLRDLINIHLLQIQKIIDKSLISAHI